MIYDTLVVVAILMFAGGIGVGVIASLSYLNIIDTSGYQDIADYIVFSPIGIFYQLYLLAIYIGFYLYFWCKGGQTLGMRAWRLKVVAHDGSTITVMQGLIRLASAAFGLGNLLVPFDGKNDAFQDFISGTQMIVMPTVK